MIYEYNPAEKSLNLAEQVNVAQIGLLEKDLENFLAKILEDNGEFMTIFQERSFQPEPDLIALDANGNLIIFELKRYSADSWTINQIMRYYRSFGALFYDELNKKFKNYAKKSVELADAHAENFGLDNPLPPNYFNRVQKMIIVANAADDSLIKDIDYFKSQGLYNIDFTPYRFYNIGEKTYFEFFTKPYDKHVNPANRKGVMFDTCEKYISGAYIDMFANSKISAYGDKEKTVNCFNKGDYVFYYKNGIIGAGVIISDTIENPNADESYREVKLLTPILKSEADIKYIRAYEIKKILKHGFFFANTAKVPYLSVDEAEILVNESRKRYNLPPI